MARKKSVKKKNSLNKEIKEVEMWIKHRRRFFWKLTWVILFIIFLIYLSNKYLIVNGVGI